jgi:hypothetical protein
MKKVIAVLGAGVGLVVLSTPPAGAAAGDVLPVECDNGESYSVVVNGNGEYTPARDTGSTTVLVPISFGNFSYHIVLPDGAVIDGSDPGAEYKGHGAVAQHNPRDTVSCTFGETTTVTEEGDEFPVGTVETFSGEVTGYLTGR